MARKKRVDIDFDEEEVVLAPEVEDPVVTGERDALQKRLEKLLALDKQLADEGIHRLSDLQEKISVVASQLEKLG